MSGRPALGRALKHRNYRLFFFGQGISLVGTWVTRIAMSWLVYRLTNSSLLLGVVGFAGQIPTFLLGPFAGVIVDRSDRYRLLIVTQVLSMLQSTLLAYYALSGRVTAWHVAILAIWQGLINAFDTPARQAFLVDMLESRDDLPNAIALNSTLVNLARLIGPSVAGVLIGVFGEGICFASTRAAMSRCSVRCLPCASSRASAPRAARTSSARCAKASRTCATCVTGLVMRRTTCS